MLRNCKEAKRKTGARQLATSFLIGRGGGCTILSSREPFKAKCARFEASLVDIVNSRPVVTKTLCAVVQSFNLYTKGRHSYSEKPNQISVVPLALR